MYNATLYSIGRAALAATATMLLSACAPLPDLVKQDPVLGFIHTKLTMTETATPQPVPVTRAAQECRSFEGKTPADVDAVYAKAMQTFGFRTIEERQFDAKRMRGLIDDNFKHRAVPGALYEMTDYATDETGRRQGVWMTMRISKGSSGATAVSALYCMPPNGRALVAKYEQLVQATIR